MCDLKSRMKRTEQLKSRNDNVMVAAATTVERVIFVSAG